ncbi:hypothetical protein [Streptomyces sp. NPDC057580]|uniref:hypothetical protein n=1 Tax=Streptomyces sp. NPDC057580 TaxID=3346173 RepID=UPI00367E4DB4
MCAATSRDGATFDADDFAGFLDAQPDVGTKWRPVFVQVVAAVPTTANRKIDKAPLRAAAWEAEVVWWAPTRSSAYRPLTPRQRAGIREESV